MFLSQGADAQLSISSRLIGQANWKHTGAVFTRQDSTAYTYLSTNRGGDLTTTLKFDNATKWVYLSDTVSVNNLHYLQDFDVNNNLLSTVTQTWSGTAWMNSTKALHTYNTANKLISTVMQVWDTSGVWMNVSRNQYTYTAGGQLLSDEMQVWSSSSSAFLPSTQKVYTYSGSTGKLTNIVSQNISGTPTYIDQFIFTHNSAGMPVDTIYTIWNVTTFDSAYRITNLYDTSGNRTEKLYQVYGSSVWNNATLDIYRNFTSMHMPQADTFKIWNSSGTGSWVENKLYTFTYNSYGQLTSADAISWNPGVGWEYALNDPHANYYYGPYVSSGVKPVTAIGGEANIYPVPAQNTLNIELKWNEAQAASIAILDMTGKVVRNWEVPVSAQYTSSVSVGNLAAGNYIIKISGAQGQIVKQLVVAH
jgi:hypothetical protein